VAQTLFTNHLVAIMAEGVGLVLAMRGADWGHNINPKESPLSDGSRQGGEEGVLGLVPLAENLRRRLEALEPIRKIQRLDRGREKGRENFRGRTDHLKLLFVHELGLLIPKKRVSVVTEEATRGGLWGRLRYPYRFIAGFLHLSLFPSLCISPQPFFEDHLWSFVRGVEVFVNTTMHWRFLFRGGRD
jgi:hypothetical protein